jgi:enamine deaminase RidA (YjgF/YER057c/UK114 family)
MEKVSMDKKMISLRDFRGSEKPAVFGLKVSEVGEWLFIAGTVPRDNKNVVVDKRDIKKQIKKVFENLEDILREGGATFNDVVQMNVYLTDESFRTPYLEFAEGVFKDSPVAQTILIVKGLHDPEVLIEIDGIACISSKKELSI